MFYLKITKCFRLLNGSYLLTCESCYLGHLDSRSSIRRVLLATSFIALAFTITQGTLELVLPDDTFHIPSRDFYVFGHGGMMFWFCSSLVFTTVGLHTHFLVSQKSIRITEYIDMSLLDISLHINTAMDTVAGPPSPFFQ